MLKNYFKVAFRNLRRHKLFATINIAGLAVGIASALLLFIVVKYEYSYNTSQKNFENIYHVSTSDKSPDGMFYTPGVPFPAMAALRTDFPDITTGTLLANYGSQVTVLKGDVGSNKKFIENTGFFFADPEFFEVFQFNWLIGNPSELKHPNVTVLTQRTAEKYFGSWKEAVGNFLLLDNAITVKVVGILENPPRNTDYPLEIVTSFETVKANEGVFFYSDSWGATTSNFQLYMLLPPQAKPAIVNQRLLAFSKKHYESKTIERTHFLRTLSEIHYDSRFITFGDHITSKSTLFTLTLIGIFIIIMACINFVNLSTAQAVGRSKEIGVRKVLGAVRKQLFIQILSETFLIVFGSVLLALLLAYLFLPGVKNIVTIEEPISLLSLETVGLLAIILIVVSFIAGFYPALVLSGFKPALALKNKITSATVGGISIRRGLVIAQFAISQILIIGTVIAVVQMGFVRNANLGFNKDEVLVISANVDSTARERQDFYRQKLLQIPGVRVVSYSSDVPSSQNYSQTNFGFDYKEVKNYNASTKKADDDFFAAYDIQFLAGRPYAESDTMREVVINETFMRKLGYDNPDDILNKMMKLGSSGWVPVVGVMRDFKTNTLKDIIQPLVMAPVKSTYLITSVKLNSTNIAKTRKEVENVWDEVFPEYAYNSSFLNETIENFYRQDQQLSFLYKVFAGIAIFLSCLGLYGLVTFMAVQKKKEIGIRKVLGASVQNIVYIFSREFIVLIVIGFAVAIPVAWYMMHEWLNNFVFRIELSPVYFLIAIVVSLLVAVAAVGYKSLKAALANPVKSLRSE